MNFQAMIDQDIMFAQQHAALRQANSDADRIEEWRTYANELEDDLVQVQAIRSALQEAINKVLPDAPLLTDAELRSRIAAAGQRAMAAVRDWGVVKEAGRTFKLPPEAELSKFLVSKEKYQKLSDLCVERTKLLNERTDMLNARIAAAAKHEGEMAGLRSRLEAMEKQLQAVREHGQQQTLLSMDAGAMAAAKDKQIEAMQKDINERVKLAMNFIEERDERIADLEETVKAREELAISVIQDRDAEIQQLKQQSELDLLEMQALKTQIAALQK